MSLASRFEAVAPHLAVPAYAALYTFTPVTLDLDLDDNEDLLVLGASYPFAGAQPSAQPGAVLLGDGEGGFAPAPAGMFPVSTLLTVHPRKVVIADFNGDSRPDLFLSEHGWDTAPFPGEQNRLYLSSGTSWIDATDRLPQLLDFSHTSAAADIDGDGDVDLFVGNGYSGQNHILSYLLINDGTGHFSMTREGIPAASGGLLDFDTVHHFPGATFADLDGDGLPELVITADASASYDQLRQTVVLWNQGGHYSESDKTVLAANASLPNQIVTDAQAMDVNQDGIRDLVLTGTQGQPFYDGAFVQVMLGLGNHQFADATADVMSASDLPLGTPGAAAGMPWGMWVVPMDFNRDGFADFAIEYNGGSITAQTPLVWLNDGTGHFTTIRAADVVKDGAYWQLGTGHWYETAAGYSLVTTQVYSGSGGLLTTGLLATQPITGTPDSGLAHTGGSGNDRVRGGDGNDTVAGGAGIDTAVYFHDRDAFAVSRSGANHVVAGPEGNDTLQGVERIECRDGDLALDLDGNAGNVAMLLGAVFGPGFVSNEAYAGIGIHYADAGFGSEALAQLALDVRAPGASHEAIVSLLYTNVVGHAPSAAEAAPFVSWLDANVYSPAQLAWFAATFDLNLQNIGFAGLQEHGLAFLPY